MEEFISKKQALTVLEDEAAKICDLLGKQSDLFCQTDCPAFEEVADTRIYGFSCEVKFLIKSGLLSEDEGQQLIKKLENDLLVVKKDVVNNAGVAWK